MPFSHHSHSGQFCAHAKDTLEDMVLRAIQSRMRVFALTEHIGRGMIDLYPEEADLIHRTEDFEQITSRFYQEAKRLQAAYKSEIDLLIGFETEWIRPSSLDIIRDLQSKYEWDFFVGSVHHVHTVPIDFDRPLYEKARDKAGGTDLKLFEHYFDSQFEMLQALKPPVVGHFDLIRLLSDSPNIEMRDHSQIWDQVQRNLEFIQSYHGILEINTSALRKGLKEAYPAVSICRAFVEIGGNFTLSDDAHAVDQVAVCYSQIPELLQNAGIKSMHYLAHAESSTKVLRRELSIEDLSDHETIKMPSERWV